MTFETRTVAAQFETRDEAEGPVIEGYAATFGQPYDMGPFWEQIDRRAFNRTLGASPDVRLLVDHEGQPLARTKSGTLELSADSQGLHMRAALEAADPDVQRLLPKMRRGDLDEMSFAFRVAPGGDEWDYSGDRTMRTLNELSLAGGDVSVVTYPANPNTSVSVRAQARSTYIERMGRELRGDTRIPARELVKLRRAIEVIEREARGLTANDTFAALSEAVNDTYSGDMKYAYVEDYDDIYVYFTICDWAEDDSDMYRQGYTLAADGMATLTGTAEQVRRRSSYALVTDPDGDPPLTTERGRALAFALRQLSLD
ncbi:MAG TPA: HK97 family phage prohead protease [Acidimicrobiales bacterium]|nr:HK97 family phage prohead protease [Acidimicrobiales bacterium]